MSADDSNISSRGSELPIATVAVILAAGLGVRLRPYTNDTPKAMTMIAGKPLLQRSIEQLEIAGIKEVYVVVGHATGKIIEFITKIDWSISVKLVSNSDYASRNNIWSISAAKDVFAQSDVLLLECDVVFDDTVLPKLLASKNANAMVVSTYTTYMDGAVVLTDDDRRIIRRFVPKRLDYDKSYLKTVNVNLISRDFSRACFLPLIDAVKVQGGNLYYDDIFGVAIELGLAKFQAVVVEEDSWFEVDNISDKKIADDLFEALGGNSSLQARHGGYWKFPTFQDSCLLVNPFFPPASFVTELLMIGDSLVRCYPSGQLDQAILAERAFGLPASRIVVGNGASELIPPIIQILGSPVVMASPSFEEYPNRMSADQIVFVEGESIFVSARKLLSAALSSKAKAIIIVNPNNPTGTIEPLDEIISVVEEAGRSGILVLVDESFIDFANPEDRASLFEKHILDRHENLIVLKSISKSYGIPGVRIGVMASSPIIAETIRENISIWNIGSFAERALELLPRYRSDFEKALEQCREQRTRLMKILESISFLTPIPSSANFIMCEVAQPLTASALTEFLIREHKILIKDCSEKRGIGKRQYVRFAVGDHEQVDRLAYALSCCHKIVHSQ